MIKVLARAVELLNEVVYLIDQILLYLIEACLQMLAYGIQLLGEVGALLVHVLVNALTSLIQLLGEVLVFLHIVDGLRESLACLVELLDEIGVLLVHVFIHLLACFIQLISESVRSVVQVLVQLINQAILAFDFLLERTELVHKVRRRGVLAQLIFDCVGFRRVRGKLLAHVLDTVGGLLVLLLQLLEVVREPVEFFVNFVESFDEIGVLLQNLLDILVHTGVHIRDFVIKVPVRLGVVDRLRRTDDLAAVHGRNTCFTDLFVDLRHHRRRDDVDNLLDR